MKLGLSKCKLSFLLKCTVPRFSRSFYLTHSVSELIRLILEIYANDCRLSVDILFYLSSAIEIRDWMELFTLFSRTGNNTGGGQLGGWHVNPLPPPPTLSFLRSKRKSGKRRGKKGCYQCQNVTVLAILERLQSTFFSAFLGHSTLKSILPVLFSITGVTFISSQLNYKSRLDILSECRIMLGSWTGLLFNWVHTILSTLSYFLKHL